MRIKTGAHWINLGARPATEWSDPATSIALEVRVSRNPYIAARRASHEDDRLRVTVVRRSTFTQADGLDDRPVRG